MGRYLHGPVIACRLLSRVRDHAVTSPKGGRGIVTGGRLPGTWLLPVCMCLSYGIDVEARSRVDPVLPVLFSPESQGHTWPQRADLTERVWHK